MLFLRCWRRLVKQEVTHNVDEKIAVVSLNMGGAREAGGGGVRV